MNLRTSISSHVTSFAATALAAGLWVACGPATPVPSSPDHPANPDAPAGQPPADSSTLAPPADQHGAAGPSEAERLAYQRAKPVFDHYCAGCHTAAGNGPAKAKEEAREHLAMDQYPFTGHHAHEAGPEVAEALGLTGEKPTMPKNDPGAVKGDELAVVQAWIDAYEKAHPSSTMHDHDDEDHEGMGHDEHEEHEGHEGHEGHDQHHP